MTKLFIQASTFVVRLKRGYRLTLLALVLFAIAVPAVAAQAHSGATASQKYTWTGTIKLTNSSVKMCATDSTWACDQGDTLEQHVNLTFTLLGYARTVFIDKSYDLYWVRVAGTSTTIYKTAPNPTPDCPSGQLVELHPLCLTP